MGGLVQTIINAKALIAIMEQAKQSKFVLDLR